MKKQDYRAPLAMAQEGQKPDLINVYFSASSSGLWKAWAQGQSSSPDIQGSTAPGQGGSIPFSWGTLDKLQGNEQTPFPSHVFVPSPSLIQVNPWLILHNLLCWQEKEHYKTPAKVIFLLLSYSRSYTPQKKIRRGSAL
ncbi:UNVERIFIED_CONTAM: hypothetical protein K2H54_023314 [Gekko kuhli]